MAYFVRSILISLMVRMNDDVIRRRRGRDGRVRAIEAADAHRA
jgi:hypothetical protein